MRASSILLALVALAVPGSIYALPSCDDEVNSKCVGDDKDMSPEGLSACLEALGKDGRSKSCNEYLVMMEGCKGDLAEGGVCASDHMNGDGVPCLMQRKTDQVSDACKKALPKKEKEPVSLWNTIWKDGKRVVKGKKEKKILKKLPKEQQKIYNKWKDKKSKRNSGARRYAIKEQKKEKNRLKIEHAASQVAMEKLKKGAVRKAAVKAAHRVVKKKCKKVKKKVIFTKDEMKEMAENAVKAAETQIRKDAQAEL